ncbi:MAG: glycosyltransferase family 39 protein [Lewinellaceae bacterium]|nr:glycosyltransferase family 39 protein [Lewinellaceae bacterium]
MDSWQYLFFGTVISAVLSFVFWQQGRNRLALFSLFVAAFLLRFCITYLDTYLHLWDERFHALVAKNMMEYPFKPMLRVDLPLPNYDKDWAHCHIWLHKQPLFLWQMALSMKMFGVNEWALRLPSVIMGSLMVLPIYRIGAILFSKNAGYYAALLWTFAFFQLQLTTGTYGMDHNDVAFSFYVGCSAWAFFEYAASGKEKLRWALLAGLFSGCAILCKWLTGGLVFGAWLAWLLASADWNRPRAYLHMLWSFGITLLVVLPWQLYAYWKFPKEYAFEMAYNAKHIWKVVEGHRGDWNFYFELLDEHFGPKLWAAVPLGLVAAFWGRPKPPTRLLLPFGILIFLPYFFFSFVAQTKVISYTFCVAPLVYVAMGVFADKFLGNFSIQKSVAHLSLPHIPAFLVLYALVIASMRPGVLFAYHVLREDTAMAPAKELEIRQGNILVYKELDQLVPEGYVLLNAHGLEEIDAMFYCNRSVYEGCPEENLFRELKQRGIKFAVFKDRTGTQVPEYIKNDPEVLVVDRMLK